MSTVKDYSIEEELIEALDAEYPGLVRAMSALAVAISWDVSRGHKILAQIGLPDVEVADMFDRVCRYGQIVHGAWVLRSTSDTMLDHFNEAWRQFLIAQARTADKAGFDYNALCQWLIDDERERLEAAKDPYSRQALSARVMILYYTLLHDGVGVDAQDELLQQIIGYANEFKTGREDHLRYIQEIVGLALGAKPELTPVIEPFKVNLVSVSVINMTELPRKDADGYRQYSADIFIWLRGGSDGVRANNLTGTVTDSEVPYRFLLKSSSMKLVIENLTGSGSSSHDATRVCQRVNQVLNEYFIRHFLARE